MNHGEVVLKSGKKKFGGKVVTFTFHLFSFDSIPPVKKNLNTCGWLEELKVEEAEGVFGVELWVWVEETIIQDS